MRELSVRFGSGASGGGSGSFASPCSSSSSSGAGLGACPPSPLGTILGSSSSCSFPSQALARTCGGSPPPRSEWVERKQVQPHWDLYNSTSITPQRIHNSLTFFSKPILPFLEAGFSSTIIHYPPKLNLLSCHDHFLVCLMK